MIHKRHQQHTHRRKVRRKDSLTGHGLLLIFRKLRTQDVNRRSTCQHINSFGTITNRSRNIHTSQRVHRVIFLRRIRNFSSLAGGKASHNRTRQLTKLHRVLTRQRTNVRLHSRRHRLTRILGLRRLHRVNIIKGHRRKNHHVSILRDLTIISSGGLTVPNGRIVTYLPGLRTNFLTR